MDTTCFLWVKAPLFNALHAKERIIPHRRSCLASYILGPPRTNHYQGLASSFRSDLLACPEVELASRPKETLQLQV